MDLHFLTFTEAVNRSIAAGWLILAVILLRLLLRKAPRWTICLLWGLAALRLVCPDLPESPVSLIPSSETIPYEILMAEPSDPLHGTAVFRVVTNPVFPVEVTPSASVNRVQLEDLRGTLVWMSGMAVMLLYAAVSWILIRWKVRISVPGEGRVHLCDGIDTPFILGWIRPKIYLPSALGEEEARYVIAHEKAHLRRFDHLWKTVGFLLLIVYWFHPLVWAAYVLMCRDLEFACDEKVISGLSAKEKQAYSAVLLSCSLRNRPVGICPLAFGEVGVKKRVKKVLLYKKPALWIVFAAVAVCTVAAVCFLTDPAGEIRNPWVQEYVPGGENMIGSVDKEKYESISPDFAIGADRYGRAVFKDPEKAFETLTERYAAGLALIREEFGLDPISRQDYKMYKKMGWQVTSGSDEAREEAGFVSGFLDIYENSFAKEEPDTTYVRPTMEKSGQLTMSELLALSEKGASLTFEDFAEYDCTDIGSGLHVCRYEIAGQVQEGQFYLLIGGGSRTGTPMYIRLCESETGDFADLMTENARDFVKFHTIALPADSAAVVSENLVTGEKTAEFRFGEESVRLTAGHIRALVSDSTALYFQCSEIVLPELLTRFADEPQTTLTLPGPNREITVPDTPIAERYWFLYEGQTIRTLHTVTDDERNLALFGAADLDGDGVITDADRKESVIWHRETAYFTILQDIYHIILYRIAALADPGDFEMTEDGAIVYTPLGLQFGGSYSLHYGLYLSDRDGNLYYPIPRVTELWED